MVVTYHGGNVPGSIQANERTIVSDPNDEPDPGIFRPFDNKGYGPIPRHSPDQRISVGTALTAEGTSEMHTALQDMYGPDSRQDQ